MGDWYILDGQNNPVLCDDFVSRRKWRESLPEDERTGFGQILAEWTGPDGVSVVTVFSGYDLVECHDGTFVCHSDGDGPMVFGSKVFGGERDQDFFYATWDEAMAGHKSLVDELSGQNSKGGGGD